MPNTQCSVWEMAPLYITRGFAVVPNAPRDKRPYHKGWEEFRIAIPDVDQYFGPNDNIGVMTGAPSGGLTCVDLDDDDAVKLASLYLPKTGMIAGRKIGGATHWFYRSDPTLAKHEFKHKPTKQKFIEVLANGQQVVVGPSIHPTGDVYDDLAGEPAEVDVDELLDAVGRLYEAVCDAKGLDPYEGIPVDQPSRQQHQQQFTGGTRPGDDYNDRGDVRELLLQEGWKSAGTSGNRERFTRPGKTHGTSGTLTDGKVFYAFSSATELDSGRGYGPFSLYAHLKHNGDFTAAGRDLAKQGYGAPDRSVDISGIANENLAGLANIDSIQAAPVTVLAKPIIPAHLLNPGGLLQMIIDFNLSTAIKPQPELALAGAIALMATITGRKVQDDYGTRPNVYLVGIAPSGSGKDHARRINKMALVSIGGEEMFQDDLASDAGLHVALNVSPSTLVQMDEFGRFLAATGNPAKAPWLYKIITVLLKLYSSSGDVYAGPSYADAKRNVRVLYPNCVLYATTVPASFFNSLTLESLSDGFFNRLLIVEASNGDPDPQVPAPFELPFSIQETIRWWHQYNPSELASVNAPAARRLMATRSANQIFSETSRTVRDRQREEESRGTQIWGRCYENGRKLSLIHQCSIDHQAAEISGESARWGCELALLLTDRIDRLAREHISDGDFDALVKKLLRYIRAAGDEGRTRTEVCRHMRAQNNRQLDDLVAKLISTEEIIGGPRQAKSGPPATVYKAI